MLRIPEMDAALQVGFHKGRDCTTGLGVISKLAEEVLDPTAHVTILHNSSLLRRRVPCSILCLPQVKSMRIKCLILPSRTLTLLRGFLNNCLWYWQGIDMSWDRGWDFLTQVKFLLFILQQINRSCIINKLGLKISPHFFPFPTAVSPLRSVRIYSSMKRAKPAAMYSCQAEIWEERVAKKVNMWRKISKSDNRDCRNWKLKIPTLSGKILPCFLMKAKMRLSLVSSCPSLGIKTCGKVKSFCQWTKETSHHSPLNYSNCITFVVHLHINSKFRTKYLHLCIFILTSLKLSFFDAVFWYLIFDDFIDLQAPNKWVIIPLPFLHHH